MQKRIRTLGTAIVGCAALTALAACKKGDGDAAPASSAAPAAAPAQAGATDVTRYGASEQAESGQLSIQHAVPARKAADGVSATVITLQPGSAVTRVARYGGYELVSWTVPGGTAMGWIDLAVAMRGVVVTLDAGVAPTTVAQPAFSNAGFGPKGQTGVPTTATTTPPSTTATAPLGKANPFAKPH